MTNRFGLSRNIPADVKRSIRKACGFGCVICGGSIIDYEHVDPPFARARNHDPQCITLLCPTCHSKVTRGFLSKDTVKSAMANPAAARRGYSSETFDIGLAAPRLVFAGVTLTNCPIPIEVYNHPLFLIEPPEDAGAPFRFSGTFYNSRGKLSLEIVQNEWRSYAKSWDVEVAAGTLTIRDGPGHISLRLEVDPPNTIIVRRLDMHVRNYHFIGSDNELIVHTPNGGRSVFTDCIADNCGVGLSFA